MPLQKKTLNHIVSMFRLFIFGIIDIRFKIEMVIKSKMIGSLPKLIALLMVLLLVGSTFVGGIFYFLK